MRRVGKMTLEPQPRQLLRRDRAGRVPHRQRRAGHRLHQRSAAAGPAVLVPRHPAHPPRRPELRRDPDQPAGRAGAQQPARRLPPARAIHTGAGQLPAELARRRLPVPAPATAAATCTTPSAVDGAQDPRAQRELRRPLQPGDAVLEQPESTASRSTSSTAFRFELGKVERTADPRAHGRAPRPRRPRPRGRGRRGHRRRGARTGRATTTAALARASLADQPVRRLSHPQDRGARRRRRGRRALTPAQRGPHRGRARSSRSSPRDGTVTTPTAAAGSTGRSRPSRRCSTTPSSCRAGTSVLAEDGDAVHFVAEAYKHAKAVGAIGDGVDLLHRAHIPLDGPLDGADPALILDDDPAGRPARRPGHPPQLRPGRVRDPRLRRVR